MSNPKTIEQKAIQALKGVYDPELPVNVYDLGLIYEMQWHAKRKKLVVVMTLTTPNCPAAEEIPQAVQEALLQVPEIAAVEVQLTFDPPYSPDRLSEEAKVILGWEVG